MLEKISEGVSCLDLLKTLLPHWQLAKVNTVLGSAITVTGIFDTMIEMIE